MLRTCSRVIALIVVGLSTAKAADAILTLACQGTIVTSKEDAKPASMGIIINFTNRTVQGFGPLYPVKVTYWDDINVAFAGSLDIQTPVPVMSITGRIDRVTGDVEATETTMGEKGNMLFSTSYALKCRPAQRMF
jgi:hypothetical protein